MPAESEKQRRFMAAELQRKREGKDTATDMSEEQLEEFVSKSQRHSLRPLKKARSRSRRA